MNTILVVEDDKTLSMGIEYALEKEGFTAFVADSLYNANQLYNSREYDLILLDVTLPDGNGFDFCKQIRKTSNIPIIFLTARDEEVNVILGLDIGGDDYVTKPFRVKELISRIKVCLRRKSISISELLVSEELKLDLIKQKLFKGEDEVILTPLEYKLILEFMKNPMQVLSRDQILERVFDIEGEFLDDNTLSVYMRRLREKVENDPSKPEYIVTVRGIGYKWNKEKK